MPQISIIIPVYNVENYIRECLDSVLSQTFTDYECILVDDGSPDNCPLICDEYAAKDSRVVVIHQKNAGVSAARNAGLDIARGEWIGFVDSDDWCDYDMFRFLYENAINHKVDVSVCGVNVFKDGVISRRDKKLYDAMFTSREAISLMFDRESSFGGFSVNKLFKKQLIDRDRLRYDESIKYMEDLLFFYHLFKIANSIYYSSQPYYYYRQIETSVTNQTSFTPAVCTAIRVLDHMHEKEQDLEIQEKIFISKIYFIYNICVGCILKGKKDKEFLSNVCILKKQIFKKSSLTFVFRCKIIVLAYFNWVIPFYLKFKGVKNNE
jgi:glycosyltransferase involved in cell wall biosynthesis